ncbi:hypothetical protein AB6D11_00890 [Vibrio splendidus]
MSQLYTKLARLSSPYIAEMSSALLSDMQWSVAANAATCMHRMLSVSERQFLESAAWAQDGRAPFKMMTPGQITLTLLLMNTTLVPDRLPTELLRLTNEETLTQEALSHLRECMKTASREVDANHHYLIKYGPIGSAGNYAALTTDSPVNTDKVATYLGDPEKLRITPMNREQLMALMNSDHVDVQRLQLPQSTHPVRWAQHQVASY